MLHFNCCVLAPTTFEEEPLVPVIVPIVPVSAVVIVIVGKETPPFIIGLELDKLPPTSKKYLCRFNTCRTYYYTTYCKFSNVYGFVKNKITTSSIGYKIIT